MTMHNSKHSVLRALACLCLIGSGAAGCSSDPDPHEHTPDVTTCPQERPVACSDDSCAESAGLCPDDEVPDDILAPIEGSIVDVSPRTVLAHAPEPVSLELAVDNADLVEQLVAEGATWQVIVETASGARAVDAEAARVTASADEAHDFLVTFTPDAEIGPQQVRLRASLTAVSDVDDTEYTWGAGALRLRGDATKLTFEGRESFSLDGVVAPDRLWGHDVDGDGFGDVIASDVEVDQDGTPRQVLRLFKCGEERCEPAGVAQTAAAGGAELAVPDLVVAPELLDEDLPGGFLSAAVSARSASDEVAGIEVLWLEVSGEGADVTLGETREEIDIASIAPGRLHEGTISPRLLLDEATGTHRPGVVVTQTIITRDGPMWSTVVADADGEVLFLDGHRTAEGLSPEELDVALSGNLASCLTPGVMSHPRLEAPDGTIVSTFSIDGAPMLAVGPLASNDEPLQVYSLAGQIDAQRFGAGIERAACKLTDLDGDGRSDLVVSLTPVGDPRSSLVVLRGIDKADIRRGHSAPQLVIDEIDGTTWQLFRHGDNVSMQARMRPQVGREIQIAAKINLGVDEAGAFTVADIESRAVAAGVPIIGIDGADAPAALGHGNDIVLRKRPGRSHDGGIGGGALGGSMSLVGEGGSWLLAQYDGSIEANAGDGALLTASGPRSVLGWLPTTGPFIPVELPTAPEEDGVYTLEDVVASVAADRTTPLLYQGLVQKTGIPTAIYVASVALLDGKGVLQDGRTIPLDVSALNLEGKKVTKFKAGAELSKTAAVSPNNDNDCNDDDFCYPPTEHLVAFQLDTGDILTGVLDPDSDDDGILTMSPLYDELLKELGLDATSDISDLRTSLRIGHDGSEPVVILHGSTLLTEVVLTANRAGEIKRVVNRDAKTPSMWGDVLGEGTDQLVECKRTEEGDATACRVLRAGGGDHVNSAEFVDDWAEPVTATGDVVAVLDLDGDRCADLLTDAGELLSSTCDGGFLPAVTLGPWAAHLSRIGGPSPTRQSSGIDYNSSRSNNSSAVAEPFDDGYGGLPFFDGIEMPVWR